MNFKYKTLDTKVVVITGAGSGIGKAMAIAFAAQGSIVWCLGRTESSLKKTIAEGKSNDIHYVVCDVSQFDEVEETFKKIIKKSGTIDILINNAASFGETAVIDESDPHKWAEVIDTNIIGTYHCTRAALPAMKKQKSGYILNISSLSTTFAYTERSPYGTTKAAIEYFTKVTASEYAKYNIVANALAPGHINGERIDKIIADRAKAEGIDENEMKQKFFKQYKLGVVLESEDVVEEVLHLIGSDVGRKMTGEVVHIKCGFRL
jgi:NAD(P)-dependent dehydrogenase (short-subunit alcohol dehydrogenase family)